MIVALKAERLKEIAEEMKKHNEKYGYPTTPKKKKKKNKSE